MILEVCAGPYFPPAPPRRVRLLQKDAKRPFFFSHPCCWNRYKLPHFFKKSKDGQHLTDVHNLTHPRHQEVQHKGSTTHPPYPETPQCPHLRNPRAEKRRRER